MSAVPFDTLKYAEALKAAGWTDAEARFQAEALADALRQGQGLATKADITELRMATKADIAELRREVTELRLEVRADMAELKAELIKWNVGAIIAMTGLFTAIVKLL